MKVGIIGGGAAGFFSAIQVAGNFPEAEVHILEKSNKLLAKVKISGGGRCNVTHNAQSTSTLAKAYPRGGKMLKKAFRIFNHQDTMQWFEERGVPLLTQADGCVFPVSQDSQSIIDCFQSEAQRLGIQVHTRRGVQRLHPTAGGRWEVVFAHADAPKEVFDKIIVATGGQPKVGGLQWLQDLGHEVVPPVPSLFTFNMPKEDITQLMGIVVENAMAQIPGTKLKATGPLLITHWGMSGPAILVLSAFGARWMAEEEYQFPVQVNWVGITQQGEVSDELGRIIQHHPQKSIRNYRPFALPERLWHFLLDKMGLPQDKKWADIGKKGIHKITDCLCHDIYQVSGKTTFKEEFVTAGGVALSSMDAQTLQSKVCPNLYFAGEVMDVDGITGGFNFQAAWTTAFIAGKLA